MFSCSDKPKREKFPGVEGATVGAGSAGSRQALMGGFDPLKSSIPVKEERARPVANNTQNKKNKAATGPTLSGTIRLSSNFSLTEDTYLFISIRPLAGGPPIAAEKQLASSLPYTFEFSAADVMIPGTPFEGEVQLTARIDQDGNPISRQVGDYFGQKDTRIGAKNIELVIDQAIKE